MPTRYVRSTCYRLRRASHGRLLSRLFLPFPRLFLFSVTNRPPFSSLVHEPTFYTRDLARLPQSPEVPERETIVTCGFNPILSSLIYSMGSPRQGRRACSPYRSAAPCVRASPHDAPDVRFDRGIIREFSEDQLNIEIRISALLTTRRQTSGRLWALMSWHP